MTIARTIMVQGTASSVGKSLLTAALCRIFSQDGLCVAPFKAQNMSNNSYVTLDGGEVGRAQALQAYAAGIEPSTDMNPVLLKPEADSRSQVVVNGKSRGSISAREYFRRKAEFWPEVTAALDRLRSAYDIVVIEGAGSPAEVNLRANDIVNMQVALYSRSPVLLVGDIDRGGVFASLLGTLELLQPEERRLVHGLVINRFRGDRALLEPLPAMIASRTGVPVVGVVPFVPELKLPDEDAAAPLGRQSAPGSNGKTLFAAVLRLPHISNFDDFDPLRRAGVQLSWVASPEQLTGAHLVIIPGTKSTIADLRWMKACRLDRAVAAASGRGAGVLGICGGYQMLCHQLEDPLGADSNAPDSESGLGLLDGVTVFAREKTTRRVEFDMPPGDGLFAGSGPVRGRGYEIHTGQTASASQHMLKMQGHEAASRDIESRDGAVSAGGWVAGTYVHGLFDNPPVLARLLGNVARRHGLPAPVVPGFSLDAELDRVAGTFRSSLDMQSVLAMTGIGVRVREQEAVR